MPTTSDELVRFAPEQRFREAIDRLFRQVEARLRALVPGADIQHVGSTAIPGALTKGDLDVQVRVPLAGYSAAKAKLATIYDVNAGGFVADDAVSFEDHGGQPSLGVHLTVIGGSADSQWRFRDLLIASPELREQYDGLKRRFDGGSMEQYRNAKAEFVERVLEGGAAAASREPGMQVRVLTGSDAGACRLLRLEGLREFATAFASSYEEEVDMDEAAVAQRLPPTEDGAVLGGFAEGTLVGMVGIRRENRLKLRHKAFLWGTYVTPAFWGRGVGGQLLTAVLAYAESAMPGLRQINLCVNASNAPAIKLYRRAGFEPFGVERAFLIVGGEAQDLVHMVRVVAA